MTDLNLAFSVGFGTVGFKTCSLVSIMHSSRRSVKDLEDVIDRYILEKISNLKGKYALPPFRHIIEKATSMK